MKGSLFKILSCVLRSMVFCSSCGKKAFERDKFCTKCGNKLTETTAKEADEAIKEEYGTQISNANVGFESIQDDNEENFIKQTTRDLGDHLEQMVETIYQRQGYETKTRQKIKGISGTYNEIDVLAKRKSVKLAIECKNFSEDRKVGIKEIRDFITKLQDLDIHRGLFVTSSYFSEDARNMAEKNPNEKQIELWDKEDLAHQIMTVGLGRNSQSNILSKTIKIENALPLQGSISDYLILHLKNKDNVTIRKKAVTFIPIYVTSFNLHEEFRAPDRKMYSHHNEGSYFLDGLSGRVLYKKDNSEEKGYNLSNEEKQIIHDLLDFEPRMLEVTIENNSNVIKLQPSIDRKNIEFQVRNQVAKDNKKTIPYDVKVGRDQIENKQYPHMPHNSSIQCQTRIVFVPRLEIEFESKEYIYEKVVMMASSVVVNDEISVCKHILGKKTTFAACDVCGVVKCEKDIILGDNDDCYCKKHIPDNIKEKIKENSVTGKLKRRFLSKS